MKENLFISVLNMSFVASYVVIFVVIARLLLKKTPKIFSYLLWAVVLFHLLCPFSFESAAGMLPINKNPIPQNIGYQVQPKINTGIDVVDSSINPILPAQSDLTDSVNPIQAWTFIGSSIWLIGIALMVIYSIVQLIRLKKRLVGATHYKNNIYLADHINSPFVMGVISPKIYLPSDIILSERGFIIAHENHHIKRFDHVTRIVSFFALAIHWFNPFIWLAFILSAKDMEMSCDEAVMKDMSIDIRRDYSRSLLRFATDKRIVANTALAFGEGDTKERIENVMKYKKPMVWVSIIGVIAVISIAIALTSSPKPQPLKNEIHGAVHGMDIQKIWENRTEYVGNNSAVSHIVSGLSFPNNVSYDSIELNTNAKPYGITINLKTDSKALSTYGEKAGQEEFKNNAMVIFSLIGNVDSIKFSLDDGSQKPLIIQFTSKEAENTLGENYFSKTQTIEGFQSVVEGIY